MMWIMALVVSSPRVLAWYRAWREEVRSSSISESHRRARFAVEWTNAKDACRWLRPLALGLMAFLTYRAFVSPAQPTRPTPPIDGGNDAANARSNAAGSS